MEEGGGEGEGDMRRMVPEDIVFPSKETLELADLSVGRFKVFQVH